MEELELPVGEAREWIAAARPRLIDCREQDEWEICRIEGAELLPLSGFAGRFREILKDPHEPILIYCHHGVRSLNAAEWLAAQGYSQVRSLAGGIDAWARLYDPAMQRY
jgi:rhodanese-related sulfurtransferase